MSKCDITALHELMRSDRPLTWLFAGDSITHGCRHTAGNKNFFEYFRQYLSTPLPNGMDRTGDLVLQTGVCSATTGDCLKYFDSWVTSKHPDIIITMLSMNDCVTISGLDGSPNGDQDLSVFSKNLEEITARYLKMQAFPIYMIPNTSSRDADIAPFIPVIREHCKRNGFLCVDHYTLFETTENNADWMSDHIHPSATGHFKMAQEIVRTLQLPPAGVLALENPSLVEYSGNPSSGDCPLSEYLQKKIPQTYCFLGSDVTAEIDGFPTARSYVAQAEEVLRWEQTSDPYPEARMRFFVNLAKRGMTLSDMAKQVDALWQFSPDLVFLMPEDENDAALCEILTAITAHGAKPVLLPCPLLSMESQQKMIDTAKELGVVTAPPFTAAEVTPNLHLKLAASLCGLFFPAENSNYLKTGKYVI